MRPARLLLGAAGALAFCAAGLASGAEVLALARISLLGAALGGVVALDLAERRIPNRLVLPAAAACAALSFASGTAPRAPLAGLAVVSLLLGLSLVRADALGMGDVKLALLVVFGLESEAAQALALGLVLAALFGLLLFVRHGRSAGRRALPLAPFLAAGSLLALVR